MLFNRGFGTKPRHAVRCLLDEAHDKKDKAYTRARRHAARLAICGAYAIVNNDPEVPYKRATHFGHHISHPSSIRNVQKELGIGKAASFILQVTNPVALAMGPRQAHSKSVKHLEGRESCGPRFVRRETLQLLDYKGTEVLSEEEVEILFMFDAALQRKEIHWCVSGMNLWSLIGSLLGVEERRR
ncbi:hypothetical protein J132_07103 [Termitomyces sp. J132]|nr:hypothetical protein H2248_005550 [Termitomyces sp. 'cryptogamus']KNZ77087.1 hypothetical protein J132_07103 [Termitomyces sp. J132]